MEKNSIRKSLPRLTYTLLLILIVLILPANMLFQLYIRHDRQLENSRQVFSQISQVMKLNGDSLKEMKQSYFEQCIQRADTAAYFVKYHPEVVSDLAQVRVLAEKLDVDEIHFFTPEGEIYAGTHPQYYGRTFDSGEQMRFFAPMLEDKSLKLCQEITPNTAEGKQMQYAAVWLEDKSGILQIGMHPGRFLWEMEDKSLDKVLADISMTFQGALYVVDIEEGRVIASTEPGRVGMALGQELEAMLEPQARPVAHRVFDGARYCLYWERIGDHLLIRSYASALAVQDALVSTALILGYILLVSVGVVCAIAWYVRGKISNNLYRITKELEKIEEGNLENIALTTGVLEFDELIRYINQLLKSIRLGWGRTLELIDHSQIPFGIFTYNAFYKKTFVNGWMLKILGIGAGSQPSQEALGRMVLGELERAKETCADARENVYAYEKNGKTTYLRLERSSDEQSVTYYAMDVSAWWQEINALRTESNRDLLTGLYNRRGLNERLEALFAGPENLGHGAMVMIDADGLKWINDAYGHRVGDGYLKAIAGVLSAAAGNRVCARLGGDEFVLFLYGWDGYRQVDKILETLREARKTVVWEGHRSEKLEFSMGYSYYPLNGGDYHQLMAIADERMYREKRERKGLL